MREENVIFNFLLSLKEVSALYIDIGDSLCKDIDLVNTSYNAKSMNNTILLLMDLSFIKKVEDRYIKLEILNELDFIEIFKCRLISKYETIVLEAFDGKIQYDSVKKYFFIYRNKIPLKLAGLFMLLRDFGELELQGNRFVTNGNTIKSLINKQAKHKRLSLEELEKKLLRDKELGAEAELFVLEYEKQKLIDLNIKKEPIQISNIDASAGFDILSFFSDDINDEKYIEVKSCDKDYNFYISENEIAKAKEKKDRYYLYLYNRFERIVKEVQNPYHFYFEEINNDWVIEATNYRIHQI